MVVYAAASQVLWRMSGAQLPHMLGMYTVSAAAGLAALRFRKHPPLEALVYLLPLLPSGVLTFLSIGDLERSRQLLIFNLSGPLALFTVLWLFGRGAGQINLWKTVKTALGPLTSVGAAAFWYMHSLGGIEFGTESNFAASGGFGPNQVASALSFGIVLLVAMLWMGKSIFRPLLWGLLAFFTIQTLLTFSRSGIAMAIGAAAVMSVFLLRTPRARLTAVIFFLVAGAVGNYMLVPWLNRYTEGAFEKRYTDPRMSNREVIARTDLEIFREHPILGVGPGMGTELRGALLGTKVAAHTEFTRLLAEHGLLGAISLAALLMISWKLHRRASPGAGRALAVGLLVWSWLYFSVNAFRLILPGVGFLLAYALTESREQH
ncbi:MAG: O-antigen ligase family protein [Thermodesulfobacteriota bacterium]